MYFHILRAGSSQSAIGVTARALCLVAGIGMLTVMFSGAAQARKRQTPGNGKPGAPTTPVLTGFGPTTGHWPKCAGDGCNNGDFTWNTNPPSFHDQVQLNYVPPNSNGIYIAGTINATASLNGGTPASTQVTWYGTGNWWCDSPGGTPIAENIPLSNVQVSVMPKQYGPTGGAVPYTVYTLGSATVVGTSVPTQKNGTGGYGLCGGGITFQQEFGYEYKLEGSSELGVTAGLSISKSDSLTFQHDPITGRKLKYVGWAEPITLTLSGQAKSSQLWYSTLIGDYHFGSAQADSEWITQTENGSLDPVSQLCQQCCSGQ